MKQIPEPVMDNQELEGTGMRWTNVKEDNTRRVDLQGRTPAQYRATARALGWTWIAMAVMVVTMLIGTCGTAQAQTMYEVQYESQADIKLYEVDYRSQAKESKNHWYWVDYPSQAKYKVYWVRYRSQADRLVYKVKYPSQTR